MKRFSFLSLALTGLLAFTFSAQAQTQSASPEAPAGYQSWQTTFSFPACAVKPDISTSGKAFFTHSESDLYMVIEVYTNGEKKEVGFQKVVNSGNPPDIQETWYSVKEADGAWSVYNSLLPAEMEKSRERAVVVTGFTREEFWKACDKDARLFWGKVESHMKTVLQGWAQE